MHKIDSNPKPSNWTLYYRDGLPVIGQAAASLSYMDEDEIVEKGYLPSPDLPIYSAKIRAIGMDNTATSPVKFITDPLVGTGKFMNGSKETATGKQWSTVGRLKLAIHNVCPMGSYPAGPALNAKNKAKVQAWLDKYEVIEVGGLGNRVMNPGEYLPDAHLDALSS